MADISVEQKSGGQKTWIFAAIAIILIIALMYWLSRQSGELDRMMVVEGDVPAENVGPVDEDIPAGESANLATISQSPQLHMDQQLVLADVEVAAPLGPRAFWAEVPGQNPFLIVFAPSVQEVDMPISGQQMNLRGSVFEVTEDLIDGWVESETLSSGSRDEASFATHYLLAERATVVQ